MTAILTKDPKFSLRMGTADDAGLVLAFMQKLGTYQRMADQITATEASLRRLLADRQGEAIFGLYDGVPVAFMYFSQTSSAFTGRSGLFIDGFFVDEAARHKGLGKIMMEYLSKLTLERGGQMLDWGCLDWNAPTIAFYEGLGAYCLDIMRIYRMSPDSIGASAERF